MARTKVLLSVEEDDLKRIDELADAAGLSRSEYMVAMSRQGNVNLFDAIGTLQRELARFQADNAGWRTEVKRNEEMVRKLDFRLDLVRQHVEEMYDLFSDDPKATAGERKILKQVQNALRMIEKAAIGRAKDE